MSSSVLVLSQYGADAGVDEQSHLGRKRTAVSAPGIRLKVKDGGWFWIYDRAEAQVIQERGIEDGCSPWPYKCCRSADRILTLGWCSGRFLGSEGCGITASHIYYMHRYYQPSCGVARAYMPPQGVRSDHTCIRFCSDANFLGRWT